MATYCQVGGDGKSFGRFHQMRQTMMRRLKNCVFRGCVALRKSWDCPLHVVYIVRSYRPDQILKAKIPPELRNVLVFTVFLLFNMGSMPIERFQPNELQQEATLILHISWYTLNGDTGLSARSFSVDYLLESVQRLASYPVEDGRNKKRLFLVAR